MTKSVGELLHALVDAWNEHDIERAVAFYAPTYEGLDVAQAAPQQGPQAIRQMLTRYFDAFPDLHFTIETLIETNPAVLVWRASGTHRGRLMNIPATGRPITVLGTSLLTLDGEQIARGLYIWDVAGMLREIGLLPDLT